MENLERILRDQRNDLMSTDMESLVSRSEIGQINLNSPLAQIVIGVRRSGKSTLCQQAMLSSDTPFAYINFDDDRLNELTDIDFDTLLQALYHIHGKFTHLFLDEIQNIPKWELFVNRMLRQRMRIIITGSNANLLSRELSTHLTGRYHQIELYPFSFEEYCRIHQVDTSALTTMGIALKEKALNDYILEGGFPELANMDKSEHRSYLQSLFYAIIEKDICRRYKIRFPETITEIAHLLLDEFAQEQSLNTIMSKSRLQSVHTIQKYLHYITGSYLVCAVPRFSLKSRERRSTYKYYAIDPAFISSREDVLQTESLGLRLENVVAIHLLRYTHAQFKQLYYLKKDKEYEIDFMIIDGVRIEELIQVTYDFTHPSVKQYNREVMHLVKAAKQFNCSNLTLIMMYGQQRDILIDGYTVHCVSAVDYLLH